MKTRNQKSISAPHQIWLTLFALVLSSSFLYTDNAFAGSSFGVGYYSGPTSGPTLNMALSSRNTLKLVAPLSFDQVICDYQFQVKRYTKGQFRFNVYFGVGTDVIFSGGGNKNKNNKAGNGNILAAVRVPFGVEASMPRYPIDLFIEVAPRMEIYNGSDVNIDASKIDWKRIGIGARYYF